MTVSVGEVARVACRCVVGVNDVVNVFHTKYKAGSPIDDSLFVNDVLGQMEDIYTPIINAFPDSQVFTDIKIDLVDFVSGASKVVRNLGVFPWPSLTVGGSSTETLPRGVCALSTFRTIVPKTLGKKYWGLMQEANWDGEKWTSGIVTTMGTTISKMIADFTSGLQDYRIVVPSTQTGVYVELLSGAFRTIAAYQRRRKPGVGA